MAINAGDLRHRITVQQPVDGAADAYGKVATTWQTWATLWAGANPISGREFTYARSFGALVSHKFVIRYREGVLNTFRILFKGRIFAINAVITVDERRREMNIYATELVGVAP